jgi:hypothetical protein
MSQAIELVLFRGKPGVDAEQMMRAARRAESRIAGLPGFLGRSFGHDSDGRFVDIVHWQDMASAKAAAEAVMQCAECAEFFALIDEREIQMLHFERG